MKLKFPSKLGKALMRDYTPAPTFAEQQAIAGFNLYFTKFYTDGTYRELSGYLEITGGLKQ